MGKLFGCVHIDIECENISVSAAIRVGGGGWGVILSTK